MAHYYILGIGSNCGQRSDAVRKAIAFLTQLLDSSQASHIYDSEAINKGNCESIKETTSPYANAVASGWSELTTAQLDAILKEYETANGRDSEARALRRVPIDIDIVVCDETILRPWDYAQSFFKTGLRAISAPAGVDEEAECTAPSLPQDTRTI